MSEGKEVEEFRAPLLTVSFIGERFLVSELSSFVGLIVRSTISSCFFRGEVRLGFCSFKDLKLSTKASSSCLRKSLGSMYSSSASSSQQFFLRVSTTLTSSSDESRTSSSATGVYVVFCLALLFGLSRTFCFLDGLLFFNDRSLTLGSSSESAWLSFRDRCCLPVPASLLRTADDGAFVGEPLELVVFLTGEPSTILVLLTGEPSFSVTPPSPDPPGIAKFGVLP